MNRAVVKIHGSEYTMVGENPKTYMIEVAEFVDKEMEKVIEHNPKLSLSQAGILTALNIAGLLFECSNENEILLKKNEELNEKLKGNENNQGLEKELESTISKLQGQLKIKTNECLSKDDEINKLNEKINNSVSNKSNVSGSDKIKFEELEKELSEAKERAKISQDLASEFQNKAYELQLKFTELENSIKKEFSKN